MGHGALGIGHWALGIGHWALGTCTERLVPSISTSLDGAEAEVSRSMKHWLNLISPSLPSLTGVGFS
jgi:hypothetical protein